jgi:hypothetical protein
MFSSRSGLIEKKPETSARAQRSFQLPLWSLDTQALIHRQAKNQQLHNVIDEPHSLITPTLLISIEGALLA